MMHVQLYLLLNRCLGS